MGKKRQLLMEKKMIIMLLIVIIVGFVVVTGRLVKLQIFDGSYYAAKALNQQLSVDTISPIRGTIYDRNMVPLAESATIWDVTASPKYIKNDVQRNSIADNLSPILKIDRQTIYNQLNNKSSYVVITKQIDQPTADLINKYIKNSKIGCIALIADSKRYYPFGNFASQLLGFTGTDGQGLSGIEAEYDSVLKGIPGQTISTKNANGANSQSDYTNYVPVQNGYNLVLTIDETVQHDLETDLSKAVTDNHVINKATGIVMNVKTGEILGMATEPSFDPSNPFTIADPTVKATLASLSGDALTQATNNALQAQWRNKAISDTYQPGSVFKVITAAGAIQEAKVNETTTFDDPGVITVGGKQIHDWDNGNNGTVTFAQAFEQSWNVVFARVGMNLGAQTFFNYFSNFGLTEKTGIDLPGEANSQSLSEKDLDNQFNLAEAAFGQGNALTPIQMITAVAAAANAGYLVKPHIVKEEADQNGNVIKSFGTTVKRQVISAETSAEIDDLLQKEVAEGSGKNAYVAGYRIGGKTGTAQKLPVTTTYVASFCGVAPIDDPQIAVIIILDNPNNPVSYYGSVIAAPVAGDIFSKILPYLGVAPEYSDAELQSLQIKAPNVIGKSVDQAKSILSSAGLKISVIGSGQTVTNQTPAGSAGIQKKGTAVIYTGNAAVQNATVPQLSGLTPDQVTSKLSAANLNVIYGGLAQNQTDETAYNQNYTQGTSVPIGTVITVDFRDNKLSVDR